jgi:hypothetical protein
MHEPYVRFVDESGGVQSLARVYFKPWDPATGAELVAYRRLHAEFGTKRFAGLRLRLCPLALKLLFRFAAQQLEG